MLQAQDGTKMLLVPDDTRFGSSIAMMQGVKELKDILTRVVASDAYDEYICSSSLKYETRENGMMTKQEKLSIGGEGDTEGDFWFEVDFFLQTLLPMYYVLRLAAGGKPCIAQVFYKFSTSMMGVEELFVKEGYDEYEDLLRRLEAIRELHACWVRYMLDPMSTTAFALNPEYHPLLGNGKAKAICVKYEKDILKGLKNMGQRLLTNHGKYVGASKEGDDSSPSLLSQYAHYLNGNADLFDFIEGASDVGAAEFYHTYGGTMPELAKVAKRCLWKGSAAAGCERNWIFYGGLSDSGLWTPKH
ncbi:unnamed protein product [Discosporangium mesarthrocarpum]